MNLSRIIFIHVNFSFKERKEIHTNKIIRQSDRNWIVVYLNIFYISYVYYLFSIFFVSLYIIIHLIIQFFECTIDTQ